MPRTGRAKKNQKAAFSRNSGRLSTITSIRYFVFSNISRPISMRRISDVPAPIS